MARQKTVIFLWSLVFAIGSAIPLGFLSGLFFAKADEVDRLTVIVIGLLWAAIPMAMGVLATWLGTLGKLPGTKKS